jgi:hypothetical protein
MKTAVIVSLVLAVGLAFATFFVRRPPPTPPSVPISWLAALSESSIDEIRFSWGEKADDLRIVRTGPSEWVMERSAVSGGVVRWPVQAAQVRGGLRLLAELANAKHTDQAAMAGVQTTLISFSMEGRPIGSMRLATKGLGGQVSAIIDAAPPRFVFVEEALSRAFLRDGVLQWRTPLALPGVASGANRIVIANPSSRVELVKTQGRWLVYEPIRATTSDPAMKQLIQTLGTLPISRFADDVEILDASLGLQSPIASIQVESPLDTGAVGRRVRIERLEVGGPADVARTTLFVRASAVIQKDGVQVESAWGPLVVVIDRARLDPIAGDASVYASKAVLRASAADVTSIRVVDPQGGRAAYTRTIDGWFAVDGEGRPGAKLEGERTKAVREFVELLCGERAAEVRADDAERSEVIWTIETGVSDGPLPVVDVVRCMIEEKPRVGLRVKGVLRLYKVDEERQIEAWSRMLRNP